MPIDVAGDLGRILSDPAGIAAAATYMPVSGASLSVNAARIARMPVTVFGDKHVAEGVVSFVIPVASVAAPASGDRLSIGGEIFTIQGVPVLTAGGAGWKLETRAASPIELDSLISVERASWMKNGFGEPIPTWSELVEVAASVEVLTDSEGARAGAVERRKAARFTVLWSATMSGVSGEDRISFDGLTWGITGAREIARAQWIEILAEVTS